MIVDDVAGVVVGVDVGTLRTETDDGVVFRGYLWIRPPAMNLRCETVYST